MLEKVELLLHKKLEAPLAVKVADSPAQIEVAEALIFTLGKAFTTMVALTVCEQPLALLPVTA
jgi:hypothetical protein